MGLVAVGIPPPPSSTLGPLSKGAWQLMTREVAHHNASGVGGGEEGGHSSAGG